MMAMRRYLTSSYDWTGFSRKFYTSHVFEYVAVAVVAIIVGLLLVLFHGNVPEVKPGDAVALNALWPAGAIEIADMIMGTILALLLLSNTYRCAKFIMGDMLFKVPLGVYIRNAWELVVHFLTQKRFAECTDKMQWFVHLLIMTGYATAFMLVAVFLAGGVHVIGLSWEPLQFQRDVIYVWYHPWRLLGYYSTFAIMYGTIYALIGRYKKSKAPYKNSHGTDWMFLWLLLLTTFTGILIHFTRLLGLHMPTYILYVVHLMIAVPMLVLEVPFAKWAHLAFRPVAVFLMKVKEDYKKDMENFA